MVHKPKPPKASPAKVAYHMRQLSKLFSRASDEQFFQLMWAIDVLRSGNPHLAANHLAFPQAAIDQSMGSRFLIHEWETETLVIQLMLASREAPKPQTPPFDCKKFADVAELVNRLRKLEDVESAVYLRGEEFNVFGEMHRIAQRQFHWQRGYFNKPQLYRYAYLYAQGKCGEYFQDKFGIPITEFNFVGFALFLQSRLTPWIKHTITLQELGLTEDLMKRALPLFLMSADKAREETKKIVDQVTENHGKPIPTAYLPSILRRYPLISLRQDSESFIAPIPEVLLLRVTSGLYYDLVPGGQVLLNDASERFEQYVADYIDKFMDRFDARRSYRYEPKKGAPIDSPDVLVNDGDRLALVIECKATKLNYLAQFAEDPFEAEKKQYRQIANGVFQLWRFFSHTRRGLVKENVDANTAAMVVTLDSFLTMNRELRAKIVEEANALADKEDGIIPEDRRPVLFCPIPDLEEVVSLTDEDRFLTVLKTARDPIYFGWNLPGISRQESEGKPKIEQKKFPFVLDDLLPWWRRTNELKEARKDAAADG